MEGHAFLVSCIHRAYDEHERNAVHEIVRYDKVAVTVTIHGFLDAFLLGFLDSSCHSVYTY